MSGDLCARHADGGPEQNTELWWNDRWQWHREPSNYTVTLNGGTTLGHVVRRTDPVSLPIVTAPNPPTGTRTVTINNSSQIAGDWTTVRNLTVNSNVGQIAVPAGAYGNLRQTAAMDLSWACRVRTCQRSIISRV